RLHPACARRYRSGNSPIVATGRCPARLAGAPAPVLPPPCPLQHPTRQTPAATDSLCCFTCKTQGRVTLVLPDFASPHRRGSIIRGHVDVTNSTCFPCGQAPPGVFYKPYKPLCPSRFGSRTVLAFCSVRTPRRTGMRLTVFSVPDDPPFIALIDDDGHSAHLLTRMLRAHGAPEVKHFDTVQAGESFLATVLADVNSEW